MSIRLSNNERLVKSWREVAEWTQLPMPTLRWKVQCHELVKRFEGAFPFHVDDVRDFLFRLNNGKLTGKTKAKRRAS